MSSDLYDTDILLWSDHQATLLRRVASGVPVTDVDWSNIIEEIADVGIGQLNIVRGCLREAMALLLKIHRSPNDADARLWAEKAGTCLDDA